MWQLYLAGEALAFDQRRISVDQIPASLPGPGDCKDGEQAAQLPEHPGVDPSTPEPKDDSDRTGQNQTKIGCTVIKHERMPLPPYTQRYERTLPRTLCPIPDNRLPGKPEARAEAQ
jgi:hypothetical protein